MRELKVSIGQYSDKGRKDTNQDFHGALIPERRALALKGIAVALADGISSSNVSHIASESAVKSFLTDYYCTSDSWSVTTSAQRVITATNSWLHSQTRKSQYAYDSDKGYVCTLSAMVLKSRTAHLFHVGDSRIYRVSGSTLEQLTEDHRVVVSSTQSYLGRALGMNHHVEIDCQAITLEQGDIFILATDGVYDHVTASFVTDAISRAAHHLDLAASLIVEEAFKRGSADNLTVQIVRIDSLPDGEAQDFLDHATGLPPPPLLEPRTNFEGYSIQRQIHASSRSHAYLGIDTETKQLAVIKIPSLDLRADQNYLKRFMMEEWIARRLNSAHVLKAHSQTRKRNYLYLVTEFVDGQTLTQWMTDHPKPELEEVRGIVEQIAVGLRAFHRMEMVHQDLRPENIMIDKTGTVKIIDLGSAKVAGIVEAEADVPGGITGTEILGTAQYTAPEYFLGEGGTWRSDLYSLGVITYQMLTGRLPYGAEVAKTRTKAQQRKMRYVPARDDRHSIPDWVDGALRKAVHHDPYKRYEALSEFVYDLRHPNKSLLDNANAGIVTRDPLVFWRVVSLILALAVLFLLATR